MLAAYGGLQFPLSTIGLPLSIYLAPFYAGELGIPLATLGIAMLLARLSDIVTDPLIGIASDRWRPRIGRRRVWVPIGIGVLLLGTWLLFNPGGKVGFPYFLVALALTYLGFTMTRLLYHAWGAELSNRYEDRTLITSVRQMFSIAGLIFATLIPAIVLTRPGATSADVLAALSIGMLVTLPLFGALLFFGVPDPNVTTAQRPLLIRVSLRQLWRNAPFRRISIILLFVAKGFCFGALELLPAAMVGDSADVDTVMSRERRQGLLFAVSGMVVNFGQAVGQGLSLNLLALVGYQAAGGNGPDALWWLRTLYCILPGVILAIPIGMLWRHPLTAARHRRFQAFIERRELAATHAG